MPKDKFAQSEHLSQYFFEGAKVSELCICTYLYMDIHLSICIYIHIDIRNEMIINIAIEFKVSKIFLFFFQSFLRY
jgi:hypothetical protein